MHHNNLVSLLLLFLLVVSIHAEEEEEVNQACRHPELRRVVENLSTQADYLNRFADIIWTQYASHIVIKDKGAAPVWTINVKSPKCVDTSMDVYKWLQKLKATQSYIPNKEMLATFTNTIKTFTGLMDALESIFMQQPLLSDMGIDGDNEIRFVKDRHEYQMFDDCWLNRTTHASRSHYEPLRSIGSTRRQLSRYRIDEDQVLPLYISEENQIWPQGYNEGKLRQFYNTTSISTCQLELVHGIADGDDPSPLPFCDPSITDITMCPFRIKFIREAKRFKDEMKIHMSLLSISGFAQIRDYCIAVNETHPEKSYFGIITQAPYMRTASLKELQTLTSKNDSVCTSIFAPKWQRIWSIRMRQLLEVLEKMGWTAVNITSDQIIVDLHTGYLVISDFNGIKSKYEIRSKYPTSSDIRDFTMMLQLKLVELNPTWKAMFPLGAKDLFRHVDITAKRGGNKNTNNEFETKPKTTTTRSAIDGMFLSSSSM